uniref:Uncharacterized protein n=1 Tax=Trichobilharzia regenti TaxID=157069 RepID=A0AA85JB95_TRIRE|nr:unnamed protein product [Trichobilharzia regenti]
MTLKILVACIKQPDVDFYLFIYLFDDFIAPIPSCYQSNSMLFIIFSHLIPSNWLAGWHYSSPLLSSHLGKSTTKENKATAVHLHCVGFPAKVFLTWPAMCSRAKFCSCCSC